MNKLCVNALHRAYSISTYQGKQTYTGAEGVNALHRAYSISTNNNNNNNNQNNEGVNALHQAYSISTAWLLLCH